MLNPKYEQHLRLHSVYNADMKTKRKTGALVLEDGTAFLGEGFGAQGRNVGELCFNTAITGYQEILTDPSYAGQIIIFTFPHIGNVGTNLEDLEAIDKIDLRGLITRAAPTQPSNWRAAQGLDQFLAARDITGLSGIDTRALTQLIREKGFMRASIAYSHDGNFNLDELLQHTRNWPGLQNMELAKSVSASVPAAWSGETDWQWPQGFGKNNNTPFHVATLDYGIKKNILRLLASFNCHITIMPANSSADDILALKPDGVFLSNGPGDPDATASAYALPVIQKIVSADIPFFGICLGHQMLALALGAQTEKMHQGHHGANHPVKNLRTGAVEIVSMNHGWTVKRNSLPDHVEETHISLFDQTNCGLQVKNKPIFSVQYHPEASPGPQDSHYLFQQFRDMMEARKSNQ